MNIPFYKKMLSFIVPVNIEETIGNNMTVLMMQLYCNQYVLGTPRAIYSFGKRYSPFRKTFSGIKSELKNVNSFLLIGTGLGSALKILQDQYAVFPNTILVDNDEDVLAFSIKYMNLNTHRNVEWKCSDAVQYLTMNKQKFDLIGIDIFNDLVQPNFVTTDSFLALCSQTLQANGICIFNMILENDNKIVEIETQLKQHFIQVKFIIDKVNTYFICSI